MPVKRQNPIYIHPAEIRLTLPKCQGYIIEMNILSNDVMVLLVGDYISTSKNLCGKCTNVWVSVLIL